MATIIDTLKKIAATAMFLAAASVATAQQTTPSASNTTYTVNLKGISLDSTVADVQKIVPALEQRSTRLIGGKKFESLHCGVLLTPSKKPCNFSFAGKEIPGIIMYFHDGKLVMSKLVYLMGPAQQVDYRNFDVAPHFKSAIDDKYGKQENSTDNGRWKFGDIEMLEVKLFKDSDYGGILYGQIALIELARLKSLNTMLQEEHEMLEKKKALEAKKKTLSDM